MTSVRRQGMFFFLLALFSSLLSACTTPALRTTQPEAITATPLRVTAFPYLSFAPLYIAQEEGFFAEQGLSVEFVRFQRNSDSLTALLLKEVDVDSILTVGLMNAIARGEIVKIAANKGVLNPDGCPADGLMARTGLGVAPADLSAETLKRLKFGVDPTWLDSYLLQQVLAKYGVDISAVATEYLPDPAARVEALREGALDVAFLSEPWITRAEQSGAATLWLPAAEIAPGFSLGILSFGPTLLERTDDVGARFLQAYLQGIAQYNEGKTERNLDIVSRFSQLDKDLLNAVCWPTFAVDGQVDADKLAGYLDWAVEQGLADRPLMPDEFWDPQYLNSPDN